MNSLIRNENALTAREPLSESGMRTSWLGITVGLAMLSIQSFGGNSSATPKGWKLIWHDEFGGKKLSDKKWNVLIREQSKHNELQ
jgi:hypothetical protein